MRLEHRWLWQNVRLTSFEIIICYFRNHSKNWIDYFMEYFSTVLSFFFKWISGIACSVSHHISQSSRLVLYEYLNFCRSHCVPCLQQGLSYLSRRDGRIIHVSDEPPNGLWGWDQGSEQGTPVLIHLHFQKNCVRSMQYGHGVVRHKPKCLWETFLSQWRGFWCKMLT